VHFAGTTTRSFACGSVSDTRRWTESRSTRTTRCVMVTQGLRDQKTLRVNYPLANKKLLGGRRIQQRSRLTSTSAARRWTRRTSQPERCSCTSLGWRSPGN